MRSGWCAVVRTTCVGALCSSLAVCVTTRSLTAVAISWSMRNTMADAENVQCTINTEAELSCVCDALPENLREKIRGFLESTSVVIQPDRECASGWRVGCASCKTPLWAVKLKGKTKPFYDAVQLAAHIQAHHQPEPEVRVDTSRDSITQFNQLEFNTSHLCILLTILFALETWPVLVV